MVRRARLAVPFLLVSLVANADGIPSPGSLYFTAYFEQNGQPLSNLPHGFVVSLWTDATSGSGTAARCTTSVTIAPSGGYVRFPLSAIQGHDCAADVRANADLWVEVSVDGTTLAPRYKLGATPVAIEADRASRLTPDASVPGSQITPGTLRVDRLAPNSGIATTAQLSGLQVRTNTITNNCPTSNCQIPLTANCQAGEVAVSGGCKAECTVNHSYPNVASGTPTGWNCQLSCGNLAMPLTAYVVCLRP